MYNSIQVVENSDILLGWNSDILGFGYKTIGGMEIKEC